MSSLTQITVPFHNANLLVVNHNNQPYTPMKPIVEGMGLAWNAQYTKLKQRFSSVIMEIITTGKDGKKYEMVCLPLRKLFGWLMSISSNKVKPELRENVIKYQNECDDVLWDYWTKGVALNSRIVSCEKISPEQQTELSNIVSRRAKGVRKVFAEMWSRHNKHFNIPRYSELYAIHFEDAKQYLENMVLRSDTGQADIVEDRGFYQTAHSVALCMYWTNAWWEHFSPAFKLINPNVASIISDHFSDGFILASSLLKDEEKQSIQHSIQQQSWYKLI